jgi:glucokinase
MKKKSPHILGFDLGGTKSSIGRFVQATWETDAYEKLPTHADQGFDAVFENMTATITNFLTPETVAIGIGIAGLLQQPEGRLLVAPHIAHSGNYPLLEMLQKKFSIPVFIENDARCFTLSEAALGAGKNKKVVIGITLGTGVGGGIVIDGKIFRGDHGTAGEIGHMLLRPGMPPYHSTNTRGEVEQFISGTAMGKRCEAAQKPEEYLEGNACSFLHPQLFQEIAWLCTSIIHLVDPSIIIFGGSAGRALKPHMHEISSELQKWVLPGTPLPTLTTAKLEHPGTLGAALLTQQ